MIAFKNSDDSSDPYEIPPNKLKKLIKALLSHDPYGEGTSHNDLSPTQIEQIISHLMYTQNKDTIYLRIDKESDGYHLRLSIGRQKK